MITPTDLIITLGLGVACGWLLKTTLICWRSYRREREHRLGLAEWRKYGRHRG